MNIKFSTFSFSSSFPPLCFCLSLRHKWITFNIQLQFLSPPFFLSEFASYMYEYKLSTISFSSSLPPLFLSKFASYEYKIFSIQLQFLSPPSLSEFASYECKIFSIRLQFLSLPLFFVWVYVVYACINISTLSLSYCLLCFCLSLHHIWI